jgi:hypothetical protein
MQIGKPAQENLALGAHSASHFEQVLAVLEGQLAVNPLLEKTCLAYEAVGLRVGETVKVAGGTLPGGGIRGSHNAGRMLEGRGA